MLVGSTLGWKDLIDSELGQTATLGCEAWRSLAPGNQTRFQNPEEAWQLNGELNGSRLRREEPFQAGNEEAWLLQVARRISATSDYSMFLFNWRTVKRAPRKELRFSLMQIT